MEHGSAVVLGGRQPACILRLALFSLLFPSLFETNSENLYGVTTMKGD